MSTATKARTSYNSSHDRDRDVCSISIEKQTLDQITVAARGITVLGMGEATHGQERITRFRVKLFKRLVKTCGYTVFVLEDQYTCCEPINKWIHTKGRPTDRITDLMLNLMWFWRSHELLGLIKWMRKWNATHSRKDQVEFKGIDVQTLCETGTKADAVTAFVQRRNRSFNRVDQEDWVKADGFRDKAMFDVFMQFYDPNRRYFLFAHNYHVSVQDLVGGGALGSSVLFQGREIEPGQTVKWLGHLLADRLGDSYYSIGNIFEHGSYLETIDLIEQNREAGTNTSYAMLPDSDIFISVRGTVTVGSIDPSIFPTGLTPTPGSASPFHALIKIPTEQPIELFNYDNPY